MHLVWAVPKPCWVKQKRLLRVIRSTGSQAEFPSDYHQEEKNLEKDLKKIWGLAMKTFGKWASLKGSLQNSAVQGRHTEKQLLRNMASEELARGYTWGDHRGNKGEQLESHGGRTERHDFFQKGENDHWVLKKKGPTGLKTNHSGSCLQTAANSHNSSREKQQR